MSGLTLSGWALPIHDNRNRNEFHTLIGVKGTSANPKAPARWLGFMYASAPRKEKSSIRFHPGQSYLDTRTNVFKFNEWVHIVGTYNGKEAIIYVNGQQSAKRSISVDSFKAKNEHFFIGADQHGNREYLSGSIDDVRIYNRALSPTEVQALYDLEKPKSKTK